MPSEPRKLAEIWEVGHNYHLRIIVGAFQYRMGATSPAVAEDAAEFEAIEVLRKIVADYDAGQTELTADDNLKPRSN